MVKANRQADRLSRAEVHADRTHPLNSNSWKLITTNMNKNEKFVINTEQRRQYLAACELTPYVPWFCSLCGLTYNLFQFRNKVLFPLISFLPNFREIVGKTLHLQSLWWRHDCIVIQLNYFWELNFNFWKA